MQKLMRMSTLLSFKDVADLGIQVFSVFNLLTLVQL